ncbi:MAG: hypothetical protein FWC79_06545 [Oscillospiraceae bacterium]|nr:hypothetical protein [Oscillospiraceae bacterium]
MKSRKMFLILLISIILISIGIVVALCLLNEKEGVLVQDRKESEQLIHDEGPMLLNEEQQEFLKSSILEIEFEEMNNAQRKSAWMLLNAMAEINFVENRQPGESGISYMMWILRMLGIELFEEIEIISYDNAHVVEIGRLPGVSGYFFARLIVENGEIYYVHYHQTIGLQMVIKGSEYGKLVYSSLSHFIENGEIHVREGFCDIAI